MKQIDFDFLTKLSLPGKCLVSPSGKQAALVLAQADLETNRYLSNLWLYADGAWKQLTYDQQVTSFFWEDDEHLLFAGKRRPQDEEKQKKQQDYTTFYRLALTGGEAEPAFSLPLEVDALEYLMPEHYLVYARFHKELPNAYVLSDEKREAWVKAKEDEQYCTHLTEIPFYANGSSYTEGLRQGLFLYHAADHEIERISSEELDVEFYQLSEDKQRLYFTASTMDAGKASLYSSIHYVELSLSAEDAARPALRTEELYPEEDYTFRAIWESEPQLGAASPLLVLASDMREYGLNESEKIYRLNRGSADLTRLREQSLETSSSLNTDVDWHSGPGSYVREGNYYFVASDRDHDAIYQIDAQGDVHKIYEADGALLALQPWGEQFLVMGLLNMLPAEVYQITSRAQESSVERLSAFNQPLFEEYKLLKPDYVPYGEDHDMDGWVIYPDHYDPHKTYPAILDIHGGPRTAYGRVFFHEMQVWAQAGYFVLFCNIHGSSARGDAFSDIRGKYGAIDYDDLMNFVDTCLDTIPQIDPERLGVTGGSYGGFMTNWIIGHTDRFKAAATQRSISNWVSMYGTSDIGFYFAGDQNATTTDDQAGFLRLWEFSPLRFINSCHTPTLIIHSDKDYRCPLEQGYQLFTALKDRGVEAEMLLFHDETHELSRSGKPKSRKRRLEGITEWMDRYVKPGQTPDQPA